MCHSLCDLSFHLIGPFGPPVTHQQKQLLVIVPPPPPSPKLGFTAGAGLGVSLGPWDTQGRNWNLDKTVALC